MVLYSLVLGLFGVGVAVSLGVVSGGFLRSLGGVDILRSFLLCIFE